MELRPYRRASHSSAISPNVIARRPHGLPVAPGSGRCRPSAWPAPRPGADAPARARPPGTRRATTCCDGPEGCIEAPEGGPVRLDEQVQTVAVGQAEGRGGRRRSSDPRIGQGHEKAIHHPASHLRQAPAGRRAGPVPFQACAEGRRLRTWRAEEEEHYRRGKQTARALRLSWKKLWCRWADSNRRPCAYETHALTG
jgi:hypothetical protein